MPDTPLADITVNEAEKQGIMALLKGNYNAYIKLRCRLSHLQFLPAVTEIWVPDGWPLGQTHTQDQLLDSQLVINTCGE